MPNLSIPLFLTLAMLLLPLQILAGSPPEGMVLIPEGQFSMGSDLGLYDEKPERLITLSAFYIDRQEVSTADFAAAVKRGRAFEKIQGPWFRFSAEGCIDLLEHARSQTSPAARAAKRAGPEAAADPDRRAEAALTFLANMTGFPRRALEGAAPAELSRLPEVRRQIRLQSRKPVRCVTWHDAVWYARVMKKRLPTEAEWERTARGDDGRVYPWGNSWQEGRCRAGLSESAGPLPAGSFPDGASPEGCLDMAGNVWEWVADWYGEDEYGRSMVTRNPKGPDGLPAGQLPGPDPTKQMLRSPLQGRERDTRKVLRGGGFGGTGSWRARFDTRGSRRQWSNPNYWMPDVGFRCAKDAR